MSDLEFRNLTVRFGTGRRAVTAVDRVRLFVEKGTVVGLVGESGSGKSTLARAAVGLVPPAGGAVFVDGIEVPVGHRRRVASREVQLVFQDPDSSLDPRMTVGDSIAEALPRRPRVTRRERDERVGRLLELVHLESDHARKLPRQLSGGQRQRVAIARAIAAEPKVLIADEITSALDASVQGSVLNLVRELQRELALTLLYISHNLAVVRYVSDAIAVMYMGRIVEVAPTDDLLRDPRHPYTQALLASTPTLRGAPPSTVVNGFPDHDAVVVALANDPPDPRMPPPGCMFSSRCPVGPLHNPERRNCMEVDPYEDATQRPHRAACHYAIR